MDLKLKGKRAFSSESGLNIPTEMVYYGMTKTAQLAICRGIAESVAGTGVTVNAVLPGPTRPEGAIKLERGPRRKNPIAGLITLHEL
jgi:NAD(P)-dependent dehydrogenase (short-subunit alcohol dehydrogenase family)